MRKVVLLLFALFCITVGLSAQSWDEMLKVQAPFAEESFGDAVSISGNYALVGVPDSGTAYIYYRNGDNWIEQATLIPADGTGSFGCSVSLDGDYAIIGAKHYNNHGSAYIFVRSGTTWTEEARLIASDAYQSDYFGTSVSISGDYAVIGAPNNNYVWQNSGAAYVFRRSGDTWAQQTKLTASDADSENYFGCSVSISGNNVLIGAYNNDYVASCAGCAYTFYGSGTIWPQKSKLIASDGTSQDYFGIDVSLSGDYAVVGAYMDDDNGSRSGSAYIFTRDGEGYGIFVPGPGSPYCYTENAKLIASDGAASDYFGKNVSISGDHVLIGSYWDSPNGTRSGSAYIFERSGTDWPQHSKLIPSDGVSYDVFGSAVAISGDYALISAPVQAGSGSAYFFERIYFIPPQNVTISYSSDSVLLSWSAVSGATSYKVYSSADPYSGFDEDFSGVYDGESWSASVTFVKKFYYVKAVN